MPQTTTRLLRVSARSQVAAECGDSSAPNNNPIGVALKTTSATRGDAAFEWDLKGRGGDRQKLYVRSSPAGAAAVVTAVASKLLFFDRPETTPEAPPNRIDGVTVALEQPLISMTEEEKKKNRSTADRATLRLHGGFKRGTFYPGVTLSRRNLRPVARTNAPEVDWQYTYATPASSSANAHELTLEVHTPRSGYRLPDLPNLANVANTWLTPPSSPSSEDPNPPAPKKGDKTTKPRYLHARLGCRHTFVSAPANSGGTLYGDAYATAAANSTTLPVSPPASAPNPSLVPGMHKLPLLKRASLLETTAKLSVSPVAFEAAFAFPATAGVAPAARFSAELAVGAFPASAPFPALGIGGLIHRTCKRPPTLRVTHDVSKKATTITAKAPLDRPPRTPEARRKNAHADAMGSVIDERELKRSGLHEWLVPVLAPYPRASRGKADAWVSVATSPARGASAAPGARAVGVSVGVDVSDLVAW